MNFRRKMRWIKKLRRPRQSSLDLGKASPLPFPLPFRCLFFGLPNLELMPDTMSFRGWEIIDKVPGLSMQILSSAEISSKVESQLKSKSSSSLDRLFSSSSASSSLPFPVQLTDNLIEPKQDVAINLIQSSTLNPLLMDYFNSSLDACNLCESLLQNIHRTRSNYKSLKKGIKLSNSGNKRVQQARMVKEFTAFTFLANPLSLTSTAQFDNIHNSFSHLLRRLTSRRRKIRRKVKLSRFCKKSIGCTLMVFCGVLAIASLVVVAHSPVALIGLPAILMTCSTQLKGKKLKIKQQKVLLSGEVLEQLCDQLDVAARGIYILINQLDTMGRLVTRLEDEVEHKKIIADMCVKNYKRSREVSSEAVRELENHETQFLEQLDELEKHVYLCFLTINRSRRLVSQQILAPLRIQEDQESTRLS